jgi:ubiquitin carboxyl-terminal hydrolase 14
LRAAFPNFAQRGAGGIYAQQDAEECWSGIISTLRNHLPANNEQGRSNGKNVVDQYMTGEMTIT